MTEPKKIPLDPSTPRIKEVKTIPMPPMYPEPMTDDVSPHEGSEKSFLKFIEDQKESRRLYQERLEKIRKENKDSS